MYESYPIILPISIRHFILVRGGNIMRGRLYMYYLLVYSAVSSGVQRMVGAWSQVDKKWLTSKKGCLVNFGTPIWLAPGITPPAMHATGCKHSMTKDKGALQKGNDITP